MIQNVAPGHLAGGSRLVDDGSEVPPFRVAQEVLEVACQPELDPPIGLLSMGFKSIGQQLDKIRSHVAYRTGVK
jgi:hypothetical protein